MNPTEITHAGLADLIAKWWFYYDEWQPGVLRALLADDFTLSCRSDTGRTSYEEFIRCDLHGADEAMAWKEDHRLNSPYPLRHNGSNIVITSRSDTEVSFTSYIFVTKILEGRPYLLSTGITSGSARVTSKGLLLQSIHTVLDTQDSVRYADRPAVGSAF
ncbi:hypothetical protein [Rhodococcus sp. MS16]|uniref:hypothetical protein n=1 Tax=Rhodococcus sp. MS16 TaxID=2579941 RepID=UPI0031FED418